MKKDRQFRVANWTAQMNSGMVIQLLRGPFDRIGVMQSGEGLPTISLTSDDGTIDLELDDGGFYISRTRGGRREVLCQDGSWMECAEDELPENYLYVNQA